MMEDCQCRLAQEHDWKPLTKAFILFITVCLERIHHNVLKKKCVNLECFEKSTNLLYVNYTLIIQLNNSRKFMIMPSQV